MFIRPLASSWPLILTVALAACTSDGSNQLHVSTYNAGLALGFVDYADERQPLVVSALAEHDADLICLQEMWRQADWDALVSATTGNWPHAYRLDDSQEVRAGGCMPDELAQTEVCVNMNCADAGPDMLADCALENCASELGSLSSECVMCITANVGRGSVAEIRTLCEGDAGSPVYAYDGSFGTGVLSRLPLQDTDALVLDSTINRRAVLYASVETDLGPTHFFCTHLTSNLTSVPYAGVFDSWEAEQNAQITAMLDFIDSKAADGEQVIIAGDLNTGPAGNGFLAELPDHYARFTAAGFENPFAAQSDVTCTYCDDNPLNLGTMGGDGGLIDHVLIRNITASASASAFLTETIDITYEGTNLSTAYSDHYGLQLSLTR